MEVLKLLDEIEDIIGAASGVPFSGKVMVDQVELFELIKNIRILLPDEIKQASYINEKKERILAEAQNEANILLEEAEDELKDLVEEDGITKEAQIKAEEIITRARENAKEIRLGALEYTDELLSNLESEIYDVLKTIKNNRDELKE